jgi:hypothetical protein
MKSTIGLGQRNIREQQNERNARVKKERDVLLIHCTDDERSFIHQRITKHESTIKASV